MSTLAAILVVGLLLAATVCWLGVSMSSDGADRLWRAQGACGLVIGVIADTYIAIVIFTYLGIVPGADSLARWHLLVLAFVGLGVLGVGLPLSVAGSLARGR
jgi:threonine/homoserine efflux transporter RhtA